MIGEERIYVISALVEHKPGVLYSVSNMFRRRGFNIESISVGEAERPDLARMTIT
ncbi:MAG TPA: acetolactate synthase small subunit, partial [Candidatus Bathyarchaeota archaeon]|nr:acetolactate synthase small subunit [Candidatus Bathyarchaeota archaeon]